MARIKRNLKPLQADPDAAKDPNESSGAADEDDTAPAVEEDEYFGDALAPKTLTSGKPKVPATQPELPTPPPKGKTKKTTKTVAGSKPVEDNRTVIRLGEPRKKLTKAAKKILEGYNAKTAGKTRDAMINGHITAARRKFGAGGVFHGNETSRLVVGIPCPLPFEFLIANDAFLLGIIYHLVGKHKSKKSGLLAEFFRWAYLAHGFGVLKECETKFSETWYRSIMRGPDPATGKEVCYFDNMPFDRCESIEDWQERLTFDLQSKESYKHSMEGTAEKPGPGRTFPILFGVDSVMGKLTEGTQATILKDGSAGRGHPVEALQISRYLATMPNWLDRWPFAVVLVNHLKLSQNPDTGQEERNTAGGKRMLFQESFELELLRGAHIVCTEFEGDYVTIRCAESSFGPDRRQIKTRVLWWEEPDDNGRFIQKTVWDWDWATTNLLHTILKGDEKSGNYNVRFRHLLKQDGFHMEFKGDPKSLGASAWSKTLGVTDKDPLSWREMGALIRETPEAVERLRNCLRIFRRPWLEGDYLEQLNKLAGDIT